jgi:4-amino-4-deoxy-L-arabinose transferase-like glycosyltransferase
MGSATRRWRVQLGIVAAVGLAIRLVYIYAFKDPAPLVGDAAYYHRAANLLARGHGFIQPDLFEGFRLGAHQAADHPPGYIAVLALPSLLGLDSPLAHQVWSALIGTATIVVIGLAGRRIANRRTGLIAAALAAVYPNFWINDGLVMSETLVLLTAALIVLAAYSLHDRPTPWTAAALGVAVAAFTLTRAEGLLLVLVLLPPLCLTLALEWRRRLVLLAVAELAVLAVVGPWTGYNLTRFERPVAVSTGLGFAMVTSNCHPAYHGDRLGYWWFGCALMGESERDKVGDGSVLDSERTERAVEYMSDHADRLPVVFLARLGRTWAFYRPLQQLEFDEAESARDVPAARVGLAMYLVMIPAAIAGAIVLRRRGAPLSPMWAIVVIVTVAVVVTFGQTRYRTPAEVPLVLLTAVAVDTALVRWSSRRTAGAPVELAPG